MENFKAAYRYVEDHQKEQFIHSQCLLTISVGQEVHEGDKFESTIYLVNKTFKSCIMLVDDTLQRHTMAINTENSGENFLNLSLKEGDDWLIRNEKYYGQLKNLSKIMRWNDWLLHPNYKKNRNKIKETINQDIKYKEIFVSTIEEFLDRYCSRLMDSSHFDYQKAYDLCLEYLIEECTAMTLWPEIQCQYEVYPGKRNLAMNETHTRFILPDHPELLHAVAIKFKNRKQLKPQQFKSLEIDYNLENILESS